MTASQLVDFQEGASAAAHVRRTVKNTFVVFELEENDVECSARRLGRRCKTAPGLRQYSTDEGSSEESPDSEAEQSSVIDQEEHCRSPFGSSAADSYSTFDFEKTLGGSASRFQSRRERHVKRTTLMLRNLPNDYTRDMLLNLLDAHGFEGCYDFVYLPMDFRRGAGLGYAFVNMVSVQQAKALRESLHGFCAWELSSHKVCEVHFGELLQGLEQHIERYRNSPVMHRAVPEACKPAIYKNGVQLPFPAPTRKIRAPKGVVH